MAEATIFETDGIVAFAATNTLTRKMWVEHIILRGTAAGTFVVVLGNATLSITTGANDLSKVIPVGRTLNYLKLTSGPADATMYAFLRQN